MPAAKANVKSDQEKAEKLLVTALEIIAEAGWLGFSFTELASRTGLTMAEVRASIGGRCDLLDQLSKTLDQAMLAVDPADMEGLSPKDRVFELMMSRLEAMAAYRAGLCRLMQDARTDPALLAMTACRLDRSMAWLQDAARLSADRSASPLQMMRKKWQRRMLGTVYLQTLRNWASDDSADLAKTMASLDKQLRRIEGLAGLGQNGAKPAAA